MTTARNVATAIAEGEFSEVERALLVLHSQVDALQSMTANEIASTLEEHGHARINVSRLRRRLESDPRCSKHSGGFRIKATKRATLTELSEKLLGPRRPQIAEFWLDPELVISAPKYVREIVDQINITYSFECFDACSVMVRRLVETLLIETFEVQRDRSAILDRNGDVVTLKHLIERAKSAGTFALSRQTKNALPMLKDVGDWSAHNRRYLAKKSDLDRIQSQCRLVLADLGHLSGMN